MKHCTLTRNNWYIFTDIKLSLMTICWCCHSCSWNRIMIIMNSFVIGNGFFVLFTLWLHAKSFLWFKWPAIYSFVCCFLVISILFRPFALTRTQLQNNYLAANLQGEFFIFIASIRFLQFCALFEFTQPKKQKLEQISLIIIVSSQRKNI